MDSRPYKHTPLSRAENIRLLRVDPIDTEAPIVDIHEFRLAKAPAYKAISYTWGDPRGDCHVVCNSRRLAITPNCRAALLRVRRLSYSPLVWIDAICIDQESDLEKSTQVPLMGEIYSRANEVLIWLGDASLESKLAIEHLRKAAVLAAETPTIEAHYKKLNDEFESTCKGLYHGRFGTRDTNPIKDILLRPWFKRVWTFQEVVLARSAMILCGDAELSWQEMEKAVYYLADHEGRHGRLAWGNYQGLRKGLLSVRIGKMCLGNTEISSSARSSGSWVTGIKKSWRRLIGITAESKLHPTDCTFYEFIATELGERAFSSMPSSVLPRCGFALGAMRERAVTNPRDRVYGIYGFLQKIGIKRLPAVNYNMSVEEVYTEMSRFVIEQDQSLFILSCILCHQRPPRLPSWVPNWSFTGGFLAIGAGFNASDASPSLFSFDSTSHATFRGAVVDEIHEVAQHSTMTPYEEEDHTFLSEDKSTANVVAAIQLVSTFQEWIKLSWKFESYLGVEPVGHAFCRTLICDGRGILEEELTETSVLFRSFAEWMVMMMANDPNKGVGMPLLCTTMESWPNTAVVKEFYERELGVGTNTETAPEEVTIVRAIQSSDACHFHQLAGSYAAQRIFSTTKGSRFALVPLGTRPGDIVVLLSGSTVPFVIRSHGSSWTLLGAAYVHGIMRGELWPGNNRLLSSFTFS